MEQQIPPDMDGERVGELLRETMADVDVPTGSVSSVIVADDFGEAVARVLGHPDKLTEGTESGGKSVPKPTEDGVRTTVLFPAAQFRQLLTEWTRHGEVSRLTGASRMFRYAIRHEFGHAKDYRIRGITGHAKLDRSSPFRVVEHERYSLEELLQEFVACAHSARTVTQDEFFLILQDHFRIVQHYRTVLHGNQRCFLSQGYETENPQRAFKYDVSAGYWEILISHAKVFGFMAVNSTLQMPGPIWDQTTNEINAIFSHLYEVLKRQWTCYHRFDEGLNREIIAIWHRLMRLDGNLWFEAGDQEDALNVEISREMAQDLQPLRLPPKITV